MAQLSFNFFKSCANKEMICWNEWLETFNPIKNNVSSNSSYDGMMFETYGNDLVEINKSIESNSYSVWTALDSDGVILIASGLFNVNRIGYFLTKISPPNFMQVLDN